MARLTALLLAAVIVFTAAFTAWQIARVDGPATPFPTPASSDRGSTAIPTPTSDLPFGDADLRALLDRLVTLDAIDALNDDALVRLVEHKLGAALRVAERELDPVDQAFVMRRVASFAAGIDAPAALEAADAIPVPALRQLYRRAVLDAWVEFDPGGVLSLVEELQRDLVDWRPLAHYDAYAVLLLTEQLGAISSGAAGMLQSAHEAALGIWAEQDPDAAIAYTKAISNEDYRERAIQVVARAYARRDRRAAMSWAQDLGQRSRLAAVGGVVAEVAQTSVEGAVELLLGHASDWESIPSTPVTFMMSELGVVEKRRLADALAARRDAKFADSLLGGVVTRWVAEHPDAALEWLTGSLLRFGDDPPIAAFAEAARRDQSFAALALERLPSNVHAEWHAAVRPETLDEAGVEALRGRPGYAAAFVEFVARRAYQYPHEVAKFIERAEPSMRSTGAGYLGARWAERNSGDAVAWAESIADSEVRAAAVGSVAASWSLANEADAVAWILAMPVGSVRDAGIAALLTMAAGRGAIDERLLFSFASDATRQEAVSRAVPRIAEHDVGRARDLIVRFLHDPVLRARAEESLADMGSGPPRASSDSRVPQQEPADILRYRPPSRPSAFRLERDAIGRGERPSERVASRRRAHATLQSRGYSGKAMREVASTLHSTNDRRFALEALERWALSDGYGALAAALGFDEPLRSPAIRKIGSAWAQREPYGALTAAERVPADLRFAYTLELLNAWARVDSESVAQYLQSLEMNTFNQTLVLQMGDVLSAHQDSARAVASKLPNTWRGVLGEYR